MEQEQAYNVFVVGLDDFNMELIRTIRGFERYRFHKLLDLEEIQTAETFPVERWLDEARQQLGDFSGTIDGIMGFWDFPVSIMVSILCHQHGTAGPPLEAVARCEHKYWSRLEQARCVPEHVPGFTWLDPFGDAERATADLELDYPVWIKPVKAFASQLGFRADGPDELRHAVAHIRAGIGRFAGPFDRLLAELELPAEVEGVHGSACIVEELVRGQQHTVAGYAYRGEVHIYGVIDSINYPDSSSFFRYRYPSQLPREVRQRMARITRRVIEHVGFDDSPFNVEFFHRPEDGGLTLLEINTRISQSHSALFHLVDGASNHQVAVELATGQRPEPPRVSEGSGPHAVASKFHLRRFRDALVVRAPGPEPIERLQRRNPGARLLVRVPEGKHLSDLPSQETYSFLYAVLYLGADTDAELMARYERCRDGLGFEFADRDPGAGHPRNA